MSQLPYALQHQRAVLQLLGIPCYVGKMAVVQQGNLLRLYQPLPHLPTSEVPVAVPVVVAVEGAVVGPVAAQGQPTAAAEASRQLAANALTHAATIGNKVAMGAALQQRPQPSLPTTQPTTAPVGQGQPAPQRVATKPAQVLADLQPFTVLAACFGHCVLLVNQAAADAEQPLWGKMLQAIGPHKLHKLSWPIVSQAAWQHADTVQAAVDGFCHHIAAAKSKPIYNLGPAAEHATVAAMLQAYSQLLPALPVLVGDVNAKKNVWQLLKPG